MAEVACVDTNVSVGNFERIHKYVWTPLNATDHTGVAVLIPYGADRCVAITGSFNTGTVLFEGSNDNTNFFTLTDAQTSAISKTAAALEQVVEAPLYVRPKMTGAGTDSITVTLICRGPK